MKEDEGFLHTRPKQIRTEIHKGQLSRTTAGLCPGYAQTNVVAIPKEFALEFMIFCQRNPKACPILEMIDNGDAEPHRMAPGANLRTDISVYHVFQDGVLTEYSDVSALWRPDLVTFLLGCSFTFEDAMIRAGIPIRHIEEDKNVPMYSTNQLCDPAGRFTTHLVVSMRPVPANLVTRVIQVTSRFPGVHGAPIHIGDPKGLGIMDLSVPDFGDSVSIYPNEIPVFWASGVTATSAVQHARLPFVITNAPGFMFITDRQDEDLALY